MNKGRFQDIREESGMMFVRVAEHSLLDVEPFLSEHSHEGWRAMQRPDFIFWSKRDVLVIEAKTTLPRDRSCEKPSSEIADLQKEARKRHHRLVRDDAFFYSALVAKFSNALLALKTCRQNSLLNNLSGRWKQSVDHLEELKRLHWGERGCKVVFYLVIKDAPDDALPSLKLECSRRILHVLRAWHSRCELFVLNEKEAERQGFCRIR